MTLSSNWFSYHYDYLSVIRFFEARPDTPKQLITTFLTASRCSPVSAHNESDRFSCDSSRYQNSIHLQYLTVSSATLIAQVCLVKSPGYSQLEIGISS